MIDNQDGPNASLSDGEIRRRNREFLIGNPFYVVAIVVSFISPAVVLVIIGAVAVYYGLIGMRSPEIDRG